jgi:hypothetical protein
MAPRSGDPIGLGDHLAYDLAQTVAHQLHRVREHAELAGHVARGDRPQVTGAKPLGGCDQSAEGCLHRLEGIAGQEEPGEHQRGDEDPELVLPISGVRAQVLRGLCGLLPLPAREIAHEACQLRRLQADRARARHRLGLASQIPQRVGDRVLGLDRRIELTHAINGEAILDGEAPERVQAPLVLKRILGRRLKRPAGFVARCREVLLGGPDLLEHAGDETAPLFGRCAECRQLLLDRVPHLA